MSEVRKDTKTPKEVWRERISFAWLMLLPMAALALAGAFTTLYLQGSTPPWLLDAVQTDDPLHAALRMVIMSAVLGTLMALLSTLRYWLGGNYRYAWVCVALAGMNVALVVFAAGHQTPYPA